MQENIDKIKHIIEKVLGHKVEIHADPKDLFVVDKITTSDEFALIKYYLQNKHLVTPRLIADLVSNQLNKYKFPAESILPVAKTWSEYLFKLETLLEQVKLRKEKNFSYHELMPSQQQLMQLQQECWQLTQQWYGDDHANLSCFYNYFIAMSQAAGVTRFNYREIAKFISADHYLALINPEQRKIAYEKFEHEYHEFILQGGCRPRGRSDIDATAISNIFYYKNAQLIFNFQLLKKIVIAALDLESYGQVPYAQRLQLWTMLHEEFADAETDKASIYHKFVVFTNVRPGEFFNYFASDLPEANSVTPQLFHDIVKIAGLQSGHLILLARDLVANWVPKRHFNLQWQRKYDLTQVIADNSIKVIRKAGVNEIVRYLPNELPYAPGHGLSLCGDGLIDGLEYRDSAAYQWNTPIDKKEDIDNWPRDIEKLFREFKIICPAPQIKEKLLGEKLVTMFLNSMAYSTIHTTQHTHIFTLDMSKFLLYLLPTTETIKHPELDAIFEFVQVGNETQDAFFLRVIFNELENEALIIFLLQLTQAMLKNFGGEREVDIYLQLFITTSGKYVFLFEPHAFLIRLENDRFLNPLNNRESVRRPQFLQPEGDNISLLSNEMGAGLGFSRKFFDDTCRSGAYDFVAKFIRSYHQ